MKNVDRSTVEKIEPKVAMTQDRPTLARADDPCFLLSWCFTSTETVWDNGPREE